MKLSIITVNLNNLEGLKKTYESVVCQTFTDYEWLVIDGGSTDGSREFIEQHQEKFAYWCSEPDKGIYNAMNKGIIQANGEYLNFMNSGDCFACEETLAGVFGKSRKEDILYGYMVMANDHMELFPSQVMKNEISWYNLFTGTLPHQASFIRKTLFEIVGLYDEELKVVSDSRWFAMAILNHGATYKFLPYIIAIFEGGGACQRMDLSAERERQRKDIFPNYITEDDILTLTKFSIIQSSRLTRLLFSVVIAIALQIVRKRQMKIIRQLSAHWNN